MSFAIQRLEGADASAMRELNALFGKAFDDSDSYASAPPGESYLERTLSRDEVVALIVTENGRVIGGLVAYILQKLEQERSEIYIYDLAVAEDQRRRGIATALIAELREIARAVGAWAIYVQADYGDEPAIALYEKHGKRQDVMHFDIAPTATR